MKKTSWAAIALLAAAHPAHSEVLRHKLGQSSVRPYVFVDDSAWEAAPKDRPLPSQNRLVGGKVPADPRDYLLRDAVHGTDSETFDEVYPRTVEEVLTQRFLPAFSQLLRADLGGSESPMGLLQSTVETATRQLKESLPQIEKELATPSGARHIVWMIAPWEKAQGADRLRERYAPGQLGFSLAARTATRDYGAKHWLFGADNRPIVYGPRGNLDLRVQEVAEKSSAVITDGAYSEKPYAVPPYVYPVALLVHLKIAPGASRLETQLLLGLQPMVQALNPPSKASGAEIGLAGVPQPGAVSPDDPQTRYPMMLATFRRNLAGQAEPLLLHLDFGSFGGYSPYSRELSLSSEKNTWRMSPYLSGDFIKGNSASYWTHLRVPVRVHLRGFDLLINPGNQTVTMNQLKTSIEVFDRQGGKLIPWPTGIKVGITEGGATEGAATEIQKAVNEMIAKAFADARAKTKAAALEKFPLAALFIDGAK